MYLYQIYKPRPNFYFLDLYVFLFFFVFFFLNNVGQVKVPVIYFTSFGTQYTLF